MNRLARCTGAAFLLMAGCSSTSHGDAGIPPDDAADTVRTDVTDDVSDGATDATTDATEDVSAPLDVTPPVDVPEPVDGSPNLEDLGAPGPLTTASLTVAFTAPASSGCTGQQCQLTLDVTYPVGSAAGRAAPFPLAIVSNGFQLPDTQYASYATRLATYGYVAVRWNTTESIFNSTPHATLAAEVSTIIDWAAAQNTGTSALAGQIDASHVFAVGHSRGGKISVLAATIEPRIVGVLGLDPVDAPPPGMNESAQYPSAVRALMNATRAIPLAVIGSSLGGSSSFGMPCAPTANNYAQFFDAARTPAFEAVIAQSGHMQFLDARDTCGFTCSVCTSGTTSDTAVRDFSQSIMIAWAERTVRGIDTSRYTSGTWIAEQIASGWVTSRTR